MITCINPIKKGKNCQMVGSGYSRTEVLKEPLIKSAFLPILISKMKISRIVFTLVLALVLFGRETAHAQDGEGENSIYAPFVSQIKTEMKNNLIRLSWLDSPDARGSVHIFRSETPFDETGPLAWKSSDLRRIIPNIEVPYGVQSYIDEIDNGGIWYYFIAATDETGRRYETFIQNTNTIGINTEGYFGSVPAMAGESSEIRNLEAVIRGDGVMISFETADESQGMVLYRSVDLITETRDLLKAVIVQSGISSPYMDYPVPGIPYYYALITEEELIQGKVGIKHGQNTTRQPLEISSAHRVGLRVPPGIRSIPLPMISVNSVSSMGGSAADAPIPTPLSRRAEAASSGLTSSNRSKTTPPKAPRAFNQDLQPPEEGGEEYSLRAIVQGPFLKRDWEASRTEFNRFLSLPRSGAAESRTRFYLGQSYYYAEDYWNALFEFLLVQNNYPQEANEWIQATLTALAKKN
jgi:hypothetical protein